MYWLIVLGGRIEGRYGAVWLAFLVVFTGACGNLAEGLAPVRLGASVIAPVMGGYWLMGLGGFSGAIYGLLGYIWMKMTFDPKCGLHIQQFTLIFLIGWLLFCMTPLSEQWLKLHVANWAHGVGLLSGMAIGYVPKLMRDLGMGKARKFLGGRRGTGKTA